MRVAVLSPGPDWSVSDVHTGIVTGLRANGITVVDIDMGARLELFGRHLPREQARVLATESALGTIMAAWPDMVIVVSGFDVTASLYSACRARGILTVLWDTECPFEAARVLSIAPHVDWVLTPDPTVIPALRDVTSAAVVPHGFLPGVHTPGRPTPAYTADVGMVGSGYQSRVHWFERVDWTGISVLVAGIWGKRPANMPDDTIFIAHGTSRDETVAIYRSLRIGVSLYRRDVDPRGGWADGLTMSPRDVEMAACGLFFLRESRPHVDETLWMLPVLDDDPAGVREQILWWLAHDDLRADRARQACMIIQDRAYPRIIADAISLVMNERSCHGEDLGQGRQALRVAHRGR